MLKAITGAFLSLLVLNAAQAQTLAQDVAGRAVALRAAWQAAGQALPTGGNPRVLSATVLTSSVNVGVAPGQAEIMLEIASGSVGVDLVQVSMHSPSGRPYAGSFNIPPYPARQAYKLPILIANANEGLTLSLYSESGTYIVDYIGLLTKAGELLNFNEAQVKALFHGQNTLTVMNSNPADTKPPRILKGQILTPTVSLSSASPVFAANVLSKDDLSGAASLSVDFMTPNHGLFSAQGILNAPTRAGLITAWIYLQSDMPTGTYTLGPVNICDAAGNCSVNNAPQNVFGVTSFQVTP